MMMVRIQCHITSGQSVSVNRSGDEEEENTVSYYIRTVSINRSGDDDEENSVISHQDSPCLSTEVGMMMMRIQCHITSGQSMSINGRGDDDEENTVSYHIRTVHVYQ